MKIDLSWLAINLPVFNTTRMLMIHTQTELPITLCQTDRGVNIHAPIYHKTANMSTHYNELSITNRPGNSLAADVITALNAHIKACSQALYFKDVCIIDQTDTNYTKLLAGKTQDSQTAEALRDHMLLLINNNTTASVYSPATTPAPHGGPASQLGSSDSQSPAPTPARQCRGNQL